MLDFLKRKLKKVVIKKIWLWLAGFFTLSTPVVIAILAAIPLFVMTLLIMLGGEKKGYDDDQASQTTGELDGVSIPAGCLKHKDAISAELKAQGVSEKHLNVMLAICSQESGGSVPDIFQSSESLGKLPNTIGAEESIRAGVKHYKQVITDAKATNIGDDKWKIALQAYNMGGGFIDYAMKEGGKYSEVISKGFSDLMASKMGWTGYGDPQYVAHVMKYLASTGGSAGSLDPNSVGSPVDIKLLNRVTCRIGGYSGHPGIDLALQEGTPVFSMTDGTVVQSVGIYTAGGASKAFFGKDNHITIKSKDNPNIYITYRHMKPGGVLVKEGQAIKAGQQIALSGNTGFSSGPHLHVEWLRNNQYAISAAIDWYTPLATKYHVVPAGYTCGV